MAVPSSNHPSLLASAIAVVLAGAPASGCFYTDSFNQRPAIDIIRLSTEPVTRGGEVQLSAAIADPDGDDVSIDWEVFACDAGGGDCDPAPYFSSTQTPVAVPVPATRASGAATRSIFVHLRGQDELGAAAVPPQELVLDVGNALPTLALEAHGLPDFTVGTEVTISAARADADDSLANVHLDWSVLPPAGASTFVFEPLPATPSHPEVESYRLLADVAGSWDVVVTATDLAGGATTEHVTVVVSADRPPCIVAVTPQAPGPGGFLPLQDATRFAAVSVDDDLDPYPAPAGDERFAPTTFHWSLRTGEGAFTALPGVTGNSLTLDPATYQLGDVVELRVEIDDRIGRDISCAEGDPTCSVSGDACLQRLTWRTEIR